MPDSRASRQRDADLDGYTERRNAGTQVTDGSGDPNRPVTKAELHEALRDHRHSTHEFIVTKFSELKEMIKDGFPDGDTRGHREAHEVLIKDAAERAAMWKSIRDKLLGGAVIAALIAVGKIVWEHFVTVVSSGPK